MIDISENHDEYHQIKICSETWIIFHDMVTDMLNIKCLSQ